MALAEWLSGAGQLLGGGRIAGKFAGGDERFDSLAESDEPSSDRPRN